MPHIIAIHCSRLLQNQLIDGQLRLLKNKLHFEADFPINDRLSLSLYNILGLHIINEKLLCLSPIGLVEFHGDLDDFQEMFLAIEHQCKHLQEHHPLVVDHDFAIGIEGQIFHQQAWHNASFFLNNQYLQIFPRHLEEKIIPYEQITGLKIHRFNRGIQIQQLCETVYLKSHSWRLLYGVLNTVLQKQNIIQTWDDERCQPYRLNQPCACILTDTHLWIYGIEPLAIDFQTIQGLDFQKEYLRICIPNQQFQLIGKKSKIFFKRICEQITQHLHQEFLGELSTCDAIPIRKSLPFLQNLTTLIQECTLWTADRHLELGWLISQQDWIVFQPKNPAQDCLIFPKEHTGFPLDDNTPTNTIILSFRSLRYHFVYATSTMNQRFQEFNPLPYDIFDNNWKNHFRFLEKYCAYSHDGWQGMIEIIGNHLGEKSILWKPQNSPKVFIATEDSQNASTTDSFLSDGMYHFTIHHEVGVITFKTEIHRQNETATYKLTPPLQYCLSKPNNDMIELDLPISIMPLQLTERGLLPILEVQDAKLCQIENGSRFQVAIMATHHPILYPNILMEIQCDVPIQIYWKVHKEIPNLTAYLQYEIQVHPKSAAMFQQLQKWIQLTHLSNGSNHPLVDFE